MKKRAYIYMIALAIMLVFTGCSSQDNAVDNNENVLELNLSDGKYMVKFDTDSTMFHVNEAMKGKAVLTVENGEGVVHLVMPSKNVLYLFSGLAADAENNRNAWIEPTTEDVTYEDGMTEEVFAFDVLVPVIDEEFDLALIGKKDVWYDHKVSVSEPELIEADKTNQYDASTDGIQPEQLGESINVSLEGGTGKVSLITPTTIKQNDDGYIVTLEWSSKNYDYMLVDGVKYLPVEVNEHSIFEIPVSDIDKPLEVVADTVAMSEPHEIEYKITFEK
ncbi:MAG: iron transporter [Lachnospiraceae bacterium]|nr:iron transporter [Candidatus Merdinaster equi]